MGIYIQNARFVEEHNQRYSQGLESFDLEVNQFADMTSEEFGQMYTTQPQTNMRKEDTTS